MFVFVKKGLPKQVVNKLRLRVKGVWGLIDSAFIIRFRYHYFQKVHL